MFNEGYSAILTTMQQLQPQIGQQCKMFADNVDKQRIERLEQSVDSNNCTKMSTTRKLKDYYMKQE